MASTKFQSAQLVECLLSPKVQVQLPVEAEEVKAKLSPAQVAKVFTDLVPGVRTFLFRQQRGQFVLKFIQSVYKDGWSAFRGTALHDHLKSLMRVVVHYGHDGKPGAASYLTQVAEAFMDCQAVQGRVVESIGLQIRGVTTNFRGLVTALVGEYKSMALKMLAYERIAEGRAHDDATPTHYENRLTADLGQQLGLNASDVRRAALDEHAQARFARLRPREIDPAVARGRELFDMDALLQALVSELNSFNASSAPDSLPRLFLDWASQNITEKHVVFDEDTCSRVEVDRTLAMAVLEVLFLGQLGDLADEMYRGTKLCELFDAQPGEACAEAEQVVDCNTAEDCALTNEVDQDKMLIVQYSNTRKCRNDDTFTSLVSVLAAPLSLVAALGNFFELLLPSRRSTSVIGA